ncbi:hypothetical protein I3843_01G297200 [Carya illinoinensis]|uniref:Uncharacterized protein n=1 Tax=Carya illinoinensis TaxID=32201 RepID=A0A8T1RU62_CARIL|nr:hypothetical protein I3760_01G303300 [Carya illinoinensis]KAG6670358.1 hypothetical protein CIPAW_01G305700 [Carya illinoinensis]KAG6735160.1 hypothetical protein I3842_01G308000 [Carya illinoinensis]KAG7999213.1 hypothetical protein I3843_01G297200 [Carya illinoinensis]
MAKPNTKPHLLIPSSFLLITFLVLSFSSSSSARLLNIVLINPPADEQADMNLQLPGDNVFLGFPLKKESRHVLPCHGNRMESSNSKRSFPATPKLTGKYGPMVLSMLPKGPLPPSGPSKRINDSNN